MTARVWLGLLAAAMASAQTGVITGRIVSPNGEPMIDAEVRLKPPNATGAEAPVETHTDANGVFAFYQLPPGVYRLVLNASGYRLPLVKIDVIGGADLDTGNVTLEQCPAPREFRMPQPPVSAPLLGVLRPEQIVIDALQPDNGYWTDIDRPAGASFDPPDCAVFPASINQRAEWEGLQLVFFDEYLSIETFLGRDTLFRPLPAWDPILTQPDVPVQSTVKLIHVTRFKSGPGVTPAKIKQEVWKTWLGVFPDASSFLGWAEATEWNVEASVEYEDGERASLVTDGRHVRVCDRWGKYWFIRLGHPVD